jgi:SAM-dependent methyltransferase
MAPSKMSDRRAFLEEYSEDESVRKYISETAGKGIQYILSGVYGPLYARVIDAIHAESGRASPFRVLEYGCGAGMNLLYIVRLLAAKGVPLGAAIGTDFSKPLIAAAEREKNKAADPAMRESISFLEASNESLLADLARGLSQRPSSLHESFDLVVGVNTFRYALRLRKQESTARDIARLLAPGGYSIMIDMNDKFPFFRSRRRESHETPATQTWVPTLAEYAAPFRGAGLELLETRCFCWIPHSAGSMLVAAARLLSPFLDVMAPNHAMRSLVIARKRARPA